VKPVCRVLPLQRRRQRVGGKGKHEGEEEREGRTGTAILGVPVAHDCPCEQHETRERALGCRQQSLKRTLEVREHMRAA
jgi:hypothetical protein